MTNWGTQRKVILALTAMLSYSSMQYGEGSDSGDSSWFPSLEISQADELDQNPSPEGSNAENFNFDPEEYRFPSLTQVSPQLFNLDPPPTPATTPQDQETPAVPTLVPPTQVPPVSVPVTPTTAPTIPTGTPGAPASPVITPAPTLAPGQADTLPVPITPQPVAPAIAPIDPNKEILINFNNVSVIEFIRFISRASGKNFIFDDANLQFNVSIVSEEPTSIQNVMTALMQMLRVHDLSLIEQGNNIVIHNNKMVNQISDVVSDLAPFGLNRDVEIITRVFRLNTLDPEKASVIVAPLISQGALVEVLKDTSHLIVTDLRTNIDKIGVLLRSLDAPNSGLTMGQYVVTNALIDSLINLAEKVMQPIAEGKPLVLVAHTPSNSIFVVSTPFLVDRTLAVLRTLDINVGQTRIFTPESLRFTGTSQVPQRGGLGGEGEEGAGGAGAGGPGGFGPGGAGAGGGGAGGVGGEGLEGEGAFGPGGAGSRFRAGTLESASPWATDLPSGHIERTKFYIHKLRYRKGEQIVDALNRIGTALQETASSNIDLISSIQSIQWLEASNSLVFTGTISSIAKVKELIEEIDVPLRQVYIEMLILDTSLDDSLQYGVNFGSRFRDDNTAGAQAFLSGANTLANALDTTLPGIDLDPTSLARTAGYNLGIIGRSISRCGIEFSSIGALVHALHDKNKIEIVMSPKLLVEDNATAEIFVGINTAFQTSSIANDQGSIITSNFEFRDVGTRMKITPLISNNDVITLDIQEEVSSVASTGTTQGSLNTQNPGPTTNLSRTTTKVHVPNKYFLVMSGMIQDRYTRRRQQVPCLGGAPLIGALFSDKQLNDQKRNLMIFIRPQIIDTDEDVDNLTRHQQDVFREKSRTKKMWKYEVEEALDLLNIKEPDVSLGDSEQFNP